MVEAVRDNRRGEVERVNLRVPQYLKEETKERVESRRHGGTEIEGNRKLEKRNCRQGNMSAAVLYTYIQGPQFPQFTGTCQRDNKFVS